MEKFEYKVLKIDNLPVIGNGHRIEELLNDLGREGWEAWGVWQNKPITINLLIFSTTKLHKEETIYLKRRILVD